MLKSSFSDRWIEAGCDEAGRGCLAGPVVAAAVILPQKFTHPTINDSKKIPAKLRQQLRDEIEKSAISFAIGVVSSEEIDQINILNASFLAMHRAISQLALRPELLLIDGNRFKAYHDIPAECIVKGDGKYLSIAAASILAKTYRDQLMIQLDAEFASYDWKNNKGYGTKKHVVAIEEHGLCQYHRKSFHLKKQLRLAL
jgi:ribonuclease HII